MICEEIEFVPINYEDENGNMLTTTNAINYTLRKLNKKEFVKLQEINSNLYIVIRNL
jgi:hypothetical protein